MTTFCIAFYESNLSTVHIESGVFQILKNKSHKTTIQSRDPIFYSFFTQDYTQAETEGEGLCRRQRHSCCRFFLIIYDFSCQQFQEKQLQYIYLPVSIVINYFYANKELHLLERPWKGAEQLRNQLAAFSLVLK